MIAIREAVTVTSQVYTLGSQLYQIYNLSGEPVKNLVDIMAKTAKVALTLDALNKSLSNQWK